MGRGSVLRVQARACKKLEARGKARGGGLATPRMLRTVIRLDCYCRRARQGREERKNFNKWICEEMFMHVFGVTQKDLIIAAIEIASLIFFAFYLRTEDVTS